MKKITSVLLVFLMIFTLCACSQTDTPENPDTDSPAAYLSDEAVMII